jgi:hypothetical protein
MAVVSLHRRHPFARQAFDRPLGEAIGAGHLAPHGEADVVGPIEIAWIFDLLVLAYPVEAHVARELHVAPVGVVVGGRQAAVGPAPLVQHHAQQR